MQRVYKENEWGKVSKRIVTARTMRWGFVKPIMVGTGHSIGVSPVVTQKVLTFVAILIAFADSDRASDDKWHKQGALVLPCS